MSLGLKFLVTLYNLFAKRSFQVHVKHTTTTGVGLSNYCMHAILDKESAVHVLHCKLLSIGWESRSQLASGVAITVFASF